MPTARRRASKDVECARLTPCARNDADACFSSAGGVTADVGILAPRAWVPLARRVFAEQYARNQKTDRGRPLHAAGKPAIGSGVIG